MWQLHRGTADWLKALSSQHSLDSTPCVIAEFDVSDCFLNTPREEVIPSLRFWVDRVRRCRGHLHFAISKDTPKSDYLGKSTSPHFWCFSSEELLTVVQWELQNNDLFEVASGVSDRPLVLRQVRGLPMGGHLSAALVELVALYRELNRPWPPALQLRPTARYRDNLFTTLPLPIGDSLLQDLASELSNLLGMPVKLEGFGAVRRMLEVRVSLGECGRASCVLAFRDDQDRQGESGDVASWPPRLDPRAKPLLPSLLSGLAAKLRLYHSGGSAGLAASWRRAYQFVRRRGYPSKWWRRSLALAALRQGTPAALLPKALRSAAAAWGRALCTAPL